LFIGFSSKHARATLPEPPDRGNSLTAHGSRARRGWHPTGATPNEHSQGAGPPHDDLPHGDVVVVPNRLSIADWIASMAGVSGVAPAGVVPTTA
jgi:hypothetical protein